MFKLKNKTKNQPIIINWKKELPMELLPGEEIKVPKGEDITNNVGIQSYVKAGWIEIEDMIPVKVGIKTKKEVEKNATGI